jgi:fused signal recognition particle receptor
VSSLVIIVIVVAVLLLVGLVVLRGRGKPELSADGAPELPRAKTAKRDIKRPSDRPGKLKAAEAGRVDRDEVPLDEESIRPISVSPADEDVSPRPPPAPISRHKMDVKGLRKGLSKVRQEGGLFGRLRALFRSKETIDPAIVQEMEEILLTSDVGVKTTQALVDEIREGLENDEIGDESAVWSALKHRAVQLLELKGGGAIRNHGVPTVVLMVGVNGTGKTTTIGKLATKFMEQGKKVLLVAGDTFRAAAVAQLQAWGERVGCEVFAGKEGADPASVIFDSIKHAIDGDHDIVLVDTAGRLHTKSNLMDELKKVGRTADKALAGAPHETLLVVDGTNGQNAVQQAEQFAEALELTGIVLTKLDGTAKGGVVLAIAAEHELPVRYIGVGERAADLREFDAEEFVEAMLGLSDDAAQAA